MELITLTVKNFAKWILSLIHILKMASDTETLGEVVVTAMGIKRQSETLTYSCLLYTSTNFLSLIIRNRNTEFFFEFHNQFYSIQ